MKIENNNKQQGQNWGELKDYIFAPLRRL